MASLILKGIDYLSGQQDVESTLATVLHSHPYSTIGQPPINFHLFLHKDKNGAHRHGGSGILTLPSEDIASLLLREYGGPSPARVLRIGGRKRPVSFARSTHKPRTEIVEKIRKVNTKQKEEHPKLESNNVNIKKIQFGWQCRDTVFSIEWETIIQKPDSSDLSIDMERREINIGIVRRNEIYYIAIRFSQINAISVHTYLDEPVIFFSLSIPPIFLQQRLGTRIRLSALPWDKHYHFAPYTSLELRLVCRSRNDLRRFSHLCCNSKRHFHDLVYQVECRELFSEGLLNELSEWLLSFSWKIAFQIQGLVSRRIIDIREALELLPHIRTLARNYGTQHTASALTAFRVRANDLVYEDFDAVRRLFVDCTSKFAMDINDIKLDDSLFACHHVVITPTAMYLDGPQPERSNRVIRTFGPKNNDRFLRVSFLDEDECQHRFGRGVDGKSFVKDRFGHFLEMGLRIAGRNFEFLAYSQSSLKEHTVWFVRPFTFQDDPVNAHEIIQGLGTFDKLPFDKRLMYCPARYGARIAQAFTATDASISVEAEEIFTALDVESPLGCFTDGVGTISSELSREIDKALHRGKGKRRAGRPRPRAFQVRLMGSKGVLVEDFLLQGRVIILRQSMIKFEAPHSLEVEIAKAFDRPGSYYLNRPLIMLLEGLGVKYEVFKKLQDDAVQAVNEASSFLHSAAGLFEQHGLGIAFKIPSILRGLDRFGMNFMNDSFYKDILLHSKHHILRELKQRARIPVPGGYTLVGVADEHDYLRPNEIFACVQEPHGSRIYLAGDILISRSPTIHPGDIQIVQAIGTPPFGSPYAREPLINTVVFSVKGHRPVPSMLGGGDLDGDEYNLLPLNVQPGFKIHPFPPAEYLPVQKVYLQHPATQQDIADFVVQYICSDVLGIVAHTWLTIADQSPNHIFDGDCLKLADLHSKAVDYPKSGNPVDPSDIPGPRKDRPDWSAPEIVDASNKSYYESHRAIGKLFRAIDLPVMKAKRRRTRSGPRHRAEEHGEVAEMLENLSMEDDGVDEILSDIVQQYLGDDEYSDESYEEAQRLFEQYVYELQRLCTTYTLSRSVSLTEAEVVVGTISQQTSNPRKRKDTTNKLKEQTGHSVKLIRGEFEYDEDVAWEDVLEKGWAAWCLSRELIEDKKFGAPSYGWIALGVIFDAIREIEQERTSRRSR